MKNFFHQIVTLATGLIPEKVSIISLNRIGALALLLSPILSCVFDFDKSSMESVMGMARFHELDTLFSELFLPFAARFYSTSSNDRPSNKTPFQRFWKGVVIGWKTPTLSNEVLLFHNHPIIRIFRVIGGLSIIYWMASKDIEPYSIVILPLAMLQFSYMIIIGICKTKHIIYLWRNGKLDVRNSP